jgi:hypothetical protein
MNQNAVEFWNDWDMSEEPLYDLDWEHTRDKEVEGIRPCEAFFLARELPDALAATVVWTYKQKREVPDPWDLFQIGGAFTLVSQRLRDCLVEECGPGWVDFYQFLPAVFTNEPPLKYWVLNLLHKVPGTYTKLRVPAGKWTPADSDGDYGYPWPHALVRSAQDDCKTYAGLRLGRRLHAEKFRGVLMTGANWAP